jgi:hypothetical protein
MNMATNSEFRNDGNREGPIIYTVWICPRCGKTAHLDRKYCNCHERLNRATTSKSAKPPQVGPCNFEVAGLNCNDCPETCMRCHSFGSSETNSDGFGGEGCRHKDSSPLCHCCRSQAKIMTNFARVNFTGLIKELRQDQKMESANMFLEIADFVREEISKPALSRIQRAMERAG